jgi:hypothetical protein
MPEDKKPDTTEAKKVLLEQAKALNIKVHHFWSVETLAEKVLEAQEAAKSAEEAKFEETANVWVHLLKDAWPVEDKRHNTGETIAVPSELADRWYEAGVARPGKQPSDD